MKKLLISLSVLGIAQLSFGQEGFTPQYIEELQQFSNGAGNLSGTSRYKALSGAMGALGGDLSATIKNPASGAVFLGSEGVITAGIHTAKTEVGNGNDFSESEFDLDQIGAVMVFTDLASSHWKNIALSMNYQLQDYVNERIDAKTNLISANTERQIDGVYADKYGTSSITNVTLSANYDNKIYVGGGLNFHSFDTDNVESAAVFEPAYNQSSVYLKDYSPSARQGNGVSVGLGMIAKVNQQIRLGAAYQSPIWYRDVEEVVTERAMFTGSDNLGEYYYTGIQEIKNYIYDLNAGQKFTGSAAFVIGNHGFISVDYTYTDFSSAKFKPENSFMGENNFISNNLQGTSAVNIGAEAVLQNFRLRGGYRYEQSPFKEIKIPNIQGSYQPFGDLTGFSVGAGYEMNGFFVDASYDFFSRDRNYLFYGNYYDTKSTAPKDIYTEAAALDALSFNAQDSGLATSINDIKEKQGNISLSVGFRF